MLLKLIFYSLFILPVLISGQTSQLKDFSSLMESLKNGNNVNAVIYYAKCKLIVDSVETPAPDAIGGMHFSTYEYFAPMSINNPLAFLTTSETILISHRKRGYVYNYVKIKIFENNKVEITARYLTPNTFEIVMDETFYTDINNSSNNAGVFLFEK